MLKFPRRVKTCKHCGCAFQIYQESRTKESFQYNYCPNCGEPIQSTRYEGSCCYQRVYDANSYHYETVEITEFPNTY